MKKINGLQKYGIIFLITSFVIGVLIHVVCLLAYGRVYYFDGYGVTSLLWILVIILAVVGAGLTAFGTLMYIKSSPLEAKATDNAETIKNISSANELAKYKEIMDQGIITQEEFDAKKKQLLGL